MGDDLHKYFRIEARELLEGLSQGVLDLERGAGGRQGVKAILRLAHTLKGAARVVKQPRLAQLAHDIESALEPHRERDEPPPRACVDELLRLVDAIAAGVAALDPAPAAPAPSAPAAAPDDAVESLRVDPAEVDALLADASEAGVQLTALGRELEHLAGARALARELVAEVARHVPNGRIRPLGDELLATLERAQRGLERGLGQTEVELAQVRDAAAGLRLVPAGSLFGGVRRAVRDAAQALGRRVELETVGGEIRLDGETLSALRDALHHVARNAVTHGLEPEAERRAAGKPPTGRVSLTVTRLGRQVSFVCADDGRGIDVAAVRRAAERRGLPIAERFGLPEAVAVLLDTGVSTSAQVSELSGRGIGLTVVRALARRLRGELLVDSEPGHGTRVELRVPVALAAVEALSVDAGGLVAVLPLAAVRRTLRIGAAEIARAGGKESIVADGEVVPLAPLAALLGLPVAPPAGAQTAVLVTAPGGLAAVTVDRLLGTGTIVSRALPASMEADPLVAGATLDRDGDPRLVLDPAALVAAARAALAAPAAEAPAPRPTVLIVDDSLTTRMLEQSILETAGYEVDLAVSAEEAWAKAQERRYGLFVVDVEMPGMDGFEFIARTRADAALRETPAILVTSRASDADFKRGKDVGARAYVVKNEFDQGRLLSTIRELIG